MAAIPATITVTFNANFAGNHRVCWKTSPSSPYDCTTIVTCTGGGASCNANIVTTVDNETCDTVTFEGYVQPTCESEVSLNKRVPFSVTFTPVPTCDGYNIECQYTIMTFSVTNAGTNYNPLNPPTVTISGGGGLGATANATVGGANTITAVTLVAPGTGYISTPSVVIDPPPVPGVTATADAVLTPCAGFNITDCDGSTEAFPSLPVNETVSVCSVNNLTIIPVPSGIVINTGGCCYDCLNITFTAGGGGGNAYYVDCSGEFIGPVALGPLATLAVCASNNSWYITSGTVAVGDPC